MDGDSLTPEALRDQAAASLSALSQEQRERLLIENWMAHDARWFNAVAGEYGLTVANRLNKRAVYELGQVEARRLGRAVPLSPVTDRDSYLLAQETMISLLGPQLLSYELMPIGDDEFQIEVRDCFAFRNVSRAGIAAQYECGIVPRLLGWLEGLGVAHAITPTPGPCLRAQGQPCSYTIRVVPAPAS